MGDIEDGSLLSTGASNRWLRAVGVFVLGGVLLALYLRLVGVHAIQRALGHVPTRRFVSLVIVGVVPVVFWGSGLHLVFVRFGIATRLVRSLLLFSAAGFLNSVTPFGQAGGDPVSAVLFKRALGTDFETGLAAIGSVNALNRVAALVLGVIGVGYLGTEVAFRGTLETAAGVTVALTLGGLVGAAVAWQYRQRLVRWSATGLARGLQPAGRLPGVTPPSRDSLVQRGYRFTEALGRLADAPGTLGLVFMAGMAGQLAVASTLWVALAALGTDAPFAVVLLLIPVAKLGGTAPTPGGFGSAEALLTALMVAMIGIDAAIAGAAALLYRASAFWLPSLVGGMAAAWYVAREPRPSSDDAEASTLLHSSPTEVATELGVNDNLGITAVLVACSVGLVVVVAVGVHSRHLLIEPDSLLVHTTRDGALVVLSFGVTWLTLRRVSDRWLE